MPRNNNTWFNLLALVDKSLWNFPSVRSRPGAFLIDNRFARYSYSCLLGLDDAHR